TVSPSSWVGSTTFPDHQHPGCPIQDDSFTVVMGGVPQLSRTTDTLCAPFRTTVSPSSWVGFHNKRVGHRHQLFRTTNTLGAPFRTTVSPSSWVGFQDRPSYHNPCA